MTTSSSVKSMTCDGNQHRLYLSFCFLLTPSNHCAGTNGAAVMSTSPVLVRALIESRYGTQREKTVICTMLVAFCFHCRRLDTTDSCAAHSSDTLRDLTDSRYPAVRSHPTRCPHDFAPSEYVSPARVLSSQDAAVATVTVTVPATQEAPSSLRPPTAI